MFGNIDSGEERKKIMVKVLIKGILAKSIEEGVDPKKKWKVGSWLLKNSSGE